MGWGKRGLTAVCLRRDALRSHFETPSAIAIVNVGKSTILFRPGLGGLTLMRRSIPTLVTNKDCYKPDPHGSAGAGRCHRHS